MARSDNDQIQEARLLLKGLENDVSTLAYLHKKKFASCKDKFSVLLSAENRLGGALQLLAGTSDEAKGSGVLWSKYDQFSSELVKYRKTVGKHCLKRSK